MSDDEDNERQFAMGEARVRSRIARLERAGAKPRKRMCYTGDAEMDEVRYMELMLELSRSRHCAHRQVELGLAEYLGPWPAGGFQNTCTR